MRKLTLLGALTALAFTAAAPSASAETFDGTCAMRGKVVPTVPYTFVPKSMDAEVFASGTCTGTLEGRPYDGPAHVYVDGRMDLPMSCGLLIAKDVPGVLTFAADEDAVGAPRIDVVAAEAFELMGHMPSHIEGAFNGDALMHIVFETDEQLVRDCLGAGASNVPFELDLQTLRPLFG